MAITPSVDVGTLHHRYLNEVLNGGNLALIDELVRPDHVDHFPPGPDLHGPQALRQFIGATRAAFPDLHLTLEDQIVVGDQVVARWTARGTHRGPFMGVPATGRAVVVSGLSLHFFVDDKM